MSFLDGRTEWEGAGMRFLLKETELIDYNLLTWATWEQATTEAMRKLVQPGWVCLDVGANIGYYTVLLSHFVGETGQVIAFEPMKEPALLAQQHIDLNGCVNAKTNPLILSDEDSKEYQRILFNYSWPYPTPAQRDPQACKPSWAQSSRLDSLSLPRVDLIKIDVDGYEWKVLRGAVETLLRCRPLLVMELGDYTLRQSERWLQHMPKGGAAGLMLSWLSLLGYEIYDEQTFEPTSLEAIEKAIDLDTTTANVIASPRPLKS